MSTKINLTDSLGETLAKMSEGNPGACVVCLQMQEHGAKIDPDSVFGGLGPIFNLDSLNIYGPRIWMLYKDVCRGNLSRTIALLRAWQLGILPADKLQYAVDHYGEGIDIEAICAQVVQKLPRFKVEDIM